jgi:hypothetical protein
LLKRRDVQAVVGLFTGLLSLGLAVAGAMACWATRPSSCA